MNDFWVQEIVLAIDSATAAIYKFIISFSVTVFRLIRKAALKFNKQAINLTGL